MPAKGEWDLSRRLKGSFPSVPSKSFTTVPPTPCLPQDSQFHPRCDQLHSVSLLVRRDGVSLGNLLSAFWNKLGKNILMERNILNIVDTWIRDHLVVSKRPVSIAKWHGVVKQVKKSQRNRILLREIKKCKTPNITAFCNYSCSVATDTLGVYCSVNR